jgi:hypothetical protein
MNKLILFLLTLIVGGTPLPARTPERPQDSGRISYDITTFEEREGHRNLLAQTIVEGPAGTDFEIKLEGSRFHLAARFLNDLAAPDALQMRATITTRRLYGQSEKNLPLYEEDAQQRDLQVGFDERLVLLPFGEGNAAGSDQLKIEITPNKSSSSDYLPSGQRRPLEIKIVKTAPGNAIKVSASKTPHRFSYTASLFEDGREVATGTVDEALLEQLRRVELLPNQQASADVVKNPLAIDLRVSQYITGCPVNQVAIDFDIEPAQSRLPSQFTSKWAGVKQIGSTFNYDLSGYYLPASDRKFELRIVVKLAQGEEE